MSPERLHVDCSTVKDIIQVAYVLFANGRVNIPWNADTPIEGPPWINSDRYVIDAKAENPQSQEMMRGPMLQELLEDRFRLKIHRESRDVPTYALTVARGGHKMRVFQEGSCTPFDFEILTHFPPAPLPELPTGQEYCGGVNANGRRWLGISMTANGPNVIVEARAIRLDDFPKAFLGSRLDRPIINQTGIDGRFDFRVEFAPDEVTPQIPQGAGEQDGRQSTVFPDELARGPSIFTALQEQLGLKLEPARGPGEFLVVDYVERPSEN